MSLFKIALMLISISILIFLFNSKNSVIDSQVAPSVNRSIISSSIDSTEVQLSVTHQSADLSITPDMENGGRAVDNPPLKQKKAKEIPVDTRVNLIARHAQNESDHARHHGHEDSANIVVSRPDGEPKPAN